MNRIITAAGVLALGLSAAAHADAGGGKNPPDHPSKRQSIGMASGAIIGAAAGGPIGAFAGLVAGAVLGDRYDARRKDIDTLQARLDESDQTLAQLSAQLRTSQEQVATLSEQLRGSQAQVAALNQELSSVPLTSPVQRSLGGEVLFRTKESTLNTATEARLADLAQLLGPTPDAQVYIDAYADQRGTDQENLALSAQRADAVRAALNAHGLPDSRITVVAHGEEGANARGDIDGYALDRRVVITVRESQPQVAQSAPEQ